MSRPPDLRYRHFTFPFALIYDGLQKLIAEPPRPTVDPAELELQNRLLTWLQENTQSRAEVLDLPNWLRGWRWDALIAAGIENGVGTLFCPECNQAWPLASVQREQWNYVDMGEQTGGVVAASGRQFQCPNRHAVFRTEDSFGFM